MDLSSLLSGGLGTAGAIGGAIYGGGLPGASIGSALGSQLGRGIGSYFQTPSPQQLAQQAQIGRLQQPTPGINFAPIERAAMNNFNNRIAPQLAEQYNGQQGAFATALGQGGSDLAERLAALRAQYNFQGVQANQQREGLLGNLLSGQQNFAQNESQFNQNQAQTGIQSLLRALGQQDINEQFGINQSGQTAQSAENEQYRQLQQLLAAANGAAGRGQNFDTVYGQAQPGLVQGAAQGGTAALFKLLGIG